MTMPRFHLAIPVDDLEAGRAFYGDLLGCPQGREDPDHWIDFDLRGHQLVLHKGELLAQGTPAELVAASGCATLADAFLKMTRSGQAVEPA